MNRAFYCKIIIIIIFYTIIGTATNSLNKYTTIINLYAIQPKSIQEGQLIISSPESSIVEQFLENEKRKPSNIFPAPPLEHYPYAPSFGAYMGPANFPDGNNTKGNFKIIHMLIILCLV